MAKKKPLPASLDEDRKAICGLWHQSDPGMCPSVLWITERRIRIHDFGDSHTPEYALSYHLQERDGQRLLEDTLEDGVSFTYRLEGDSLHLVLCPDRSDNRWDALVGEWRRVK